MPLYESTFITRPEISGQQAEALAERFAGIITENGGKVEKTEYWGLKSLAYRIKKHRKGHYIMFNLDAPSAAVKEMERNMSLDEEVLRILTVRVKELEEGPSAMMRAKSSRGDRGDRGGRSHEARGGDNDQAKAAGPKTTDAKAAEPKTADAKAAEPKTADAKAAEPKTADAESASSKADEAASDTTTGDES